MNIIEELNLITNENKKYQLLSSYKTLKQVDQVIDYHNNNTASDKSLVIINIYGLLQSLFVGIDSLYSLVIGITNNKYNINVNQNKTLNGLKHIRNDIVGHPTNRRYGQNGIAYSIIDNDKLTYNEFKYDTYIFINNKMDEKEVVVNLMELKQEYLKEKEIIINRLTEFMNNKVKMVNLDQEVLELFYNPNIKNIEIIRNKFIKHYGNISNHRFIWRLDFIAYAINWFDEDLEVQDFINYIIKYQSLRLLEIALDMEKKSMKKPHIKIPPLLRKVYRYLDKNPNLHQYTKNLHDDNNPYYSSDLDYLITSTDDKSFLKLLDLLKNAKDDKIIYLVGSSIKNYKKK